MEVSASAKKAPPRGWGEGLGEGVCRSLNTLNRDDIIAIAGGASSATFLAKLPELGTDRQRHRRARRPSWPAVQGKTHHEAHPARRSQHE
jgi:hypothetical protein